MFLCACGIESRVCVCVQELAATRALLAERDAQIAALLAENAALQRALDEALVRVLL